MIRILAPIMIFSAMLSSQAFADNHWEKLRAEAGYSKKTDLDGGDLAAILAALPEFKRIYGSPMNHRISVVEVPAKILVHFYDPEVDPGCRGGGCGRGWLIVTLDKANLSVLSAVVPK